MGKAGERPNRIRGHIRSNVVGYVALFASLTLGPAWAASVKSDRDGGKAVAAAKKKKAKRGPPGPAGPAGPQGPSGGGGPPTGQAGGDLSGNYPSPVLAPHAVGARAYGRVAANGALTRSKNVTSVTAPVTGSYCIDPAPGINVATSVLIVSNDQETNATNSGSDDATEVDWWPVAANCNPGTEMQVKVFVLDGVPASGGAMDTGGFQVTDNVGVGFAFMIP